MNRIALTQPAHLRFDVIGDRVTTIMLALAWIVLVGIVAFPIAPAGVVAILICLEPMAREWPLVRGSQVVLGVMAAGLLAAFGHFLTFVMMLAVFLLVLLLVITETCRLIGECLSVPEIRGRVISVRASVALAALFVPAQLFADFAIIVLAAPPLLFGLFILFSLLFTTSNRCADAARAAGHRPALGAGGTGE